MKHAHICAILGYLVLSAASVDAREALLSVESRVGGDSNVFRSIDDEVDDGFFEFAPRIGIREQRDELNYDFSYSPVYETFFETDNIDGWDHGVNGALMWRSTPLDTLGMAGNFSQSRRVRQDFASLPGSVEPVLEESDRERIRRSYATVYYSKQFTPIIGGRVDVSFEDFDFNSDRNVDTRAYSGSVSGNYAYSAQTVLGLYASGRYRENRGVGLQGSSQSSIGNIAATVTHEFMRGLDLSVQVGPSIISTQEDDRGPITRSLYDYAASGPTTGVARTVETNAPRTFCVVSGVVAFDACPVVNYSGVPPVNSLVTLAAPSGGRGESDTDVSYFAEVEISKKWRHARLVLSYTRSESASGGVASSSIVDSVAARISYGSERSWYVALRGEWSQRGVVADVNQSVVVATPGPPLSPSPLPGTAFSFARATALTTLTTQDAGSSDETIWRVTLYGDRNITPRLKAIGRIKFMKSDRQNIGQSVETTLIFGYIGLRYDFDPVIF